MFKRVKDTVMEKKKNIKNRWLHLRMDESEHAQLMEMFAKTTEKKLSKYARKIILRNPMIATYRNQSLDEIIVILTRLQNDLNGIANNYNQMVHKLHILDDSDKLKVWISAYEHQRKLLFEDIATIKDYIRQTAEQWLQ